MMSKPIKKPLNTIDLAEEVNKGFSKIDQLDARLERYSTAKHRALENLQTLDETVPLNVEHGIAITKAVERLKGCGNYLTFHHYYTVGAVKLAKARFCMQTLLCPFCAMRRASRTLEAYLTRYRILKAANPTWRLSMITLTVKNGNDLQERFNHLQESVQRIFERRRDWLKKGRGLTEWRKVYGYVGTYEFTHKGKGWHPHAHIMVLHTYTFDYKAMQAEWKEVTGDSHVLNVTAAMNPTEPEKDFMEVFKYSVKFSDLLPEDNIHAWGVLKGKRLLFSGGAFRGVEIPESLTDELLEDLPYIELIYRYTVYGYSLESSLIKESSKT